MSKIVLPDNLVEGRSTKVIYQIYPQTFADSDGDGFGDLQGITKKMGYVAHLGVDATMLGPIHPTPDDPAKSDGGYAVSDHHDINPKYGTLADFDRFVMVAARYNLGVVMDPVVCHTSVEHPWFMKSRQGEETYKDFFVWHPGKIFGTDQNWRPGSEGLRIEPNNWLSCFGGSAWKLDPQRNEYYLHHFSEYQPALRLSDEKVQDALFNELRFWKDRYVHLNEDRAHVKVGVVGMRIDAAPFAVCDPNLTHDDWLNGWPNNRANESWKDQYHNHSICQPGAVDVFKRMRQALGDDFFLLGEVIAGPEGGRNAHPIAAAYRGAFNASYTDLSVPFVFDNAYALRWKANQNKLLFPGDEICLGTGNHDFPRMVSRLESLPGGALRSKAIRQEMLRIFCEPGDKILYNGDELGLPQASVPYELQKDHQPSGECRDGSRTPLPWVNAGARTAHNAGFSSSTHPWLPSPAEHLQLAASAQEHCKRSNLQFVRSALLWRKEQPALVSGQTFYLDNDGDIYGMVRATKEQAMLLLFNRGDRTQSLDLRDYLSDDLLQRFRLKEQPVVTLNPYDVRIEDHKSPTSEGATIRPHYHISAKQVVERLQASAMPSCERCHGGCRGDFSFKTEQAASGPLHQLHM